MLRTLFRRMLTAAVAIAAGSSALGFSLLGPIDTTYQLTTLGYNPPFTFNSREGDLGGPMNLNEEYRWNSPFIVYGFDVSFDKYFGPKGVAAVEAAIQQINSLPAMSAMSHSLEEYPLETSRFNYTAQQLGIVDIKSLVMSLMLEQLGLAAPERYVKTIFQQREPAPRVFVYSTITRNFSPLPFVPGDIRTYSYSPYVNGTLYTYVIRHVPSTPEYWDAQDIAVDVANPRISVAALAGLQSGVVDPRNSGLALGSIFRPSAGLFYTGFTRDDVGGLRYLYHSARTNVESLPFGSGLGSGVGGGGGGGGGSGSPWTITIPFISTNAVAATNGATTAGLVDLAWRGGVDRLVFVRIDPDPFVNQFPRPLALRYTERVFNPTLNRFVNQTVERTFSRPDITFAAGDIGAAGNAPLPYEFSHSVGAFNNRGAENSGIGLTAAGPGTIDSGGVGSLLILNKVGPWTYNQRETDEDISTPGFIFGSFDGTTNSPTVYPTGVTAKDLERIIFGQN